MTTAISSPLAAKGITAPAAFDRPTWMIGEIDVVTEVINQNGSGPIMVARPSAPTLWRKWRMC